MNKTQPQLKKKSLMALVEKVIGLTEGKKNFITPSSKPYAVELGDRLGMSPLHATFLSVFINMCDDSQIHMRDIAAHFGVKTIAVIDQLDILENLLQIGLIVRKKDKDGNDSYRIPAQVVRGLKKGQMPDVKTIEGLTIDKFVDSIFDLLDSRRQEEIEDDELYANIGELINRNMHLSLAGQIKNFGFDDETLIVFLVMSMNCICYHDDRQMRHDIEDYMSRSACRLHANELERGTHILMRENLVEHVCEDGRAETTVWKLTDHAKQDVFMELKLAVTAPVPANLTRCTDIKVKNLFFNDRVSKQVSRLESLLDSTRMSDILKSMESHGMRKGFTCLFYGAPGTGKTETAMQLARRTGRDIMLVDIPSIRSKWVGDTEKNIKAVFDRYRACAKDNANAPILLFNEADALFTKRNEGGTGSVDKMENAMQNIILQELESLEGILIATTNLTGSLDAAFERRFLYKIEFDKPQPEQRMHIWKSMLPDLTDSDAMSLADRFDFSGGQIENIARKRIVNDILDCREGIDLESIVESCENERIDQKKSTDKKIGF